MKRTDASGERREADREARVAKLLKVGDDTKDGGDSCTTESWKECEGSVE